MKTCKVCDKSFLVFTQQPTSKCQPCQAEYQRNHYAKNKERYNAANKVRYEENKQHYNRNAKQRYLTKTFDLSVAEYDAMREASTACALCLGPFDEQGSQLDHCHTTGKVREFLCAKCNRGIGLFGDSVEKLKLAIKYLEKHGNQ